MKKLKYIKLKRSDYWSQLSTLTSQDIAAAIKIGLKQIDLNIKYFGDNFQSPQAINGIYRKMDNIEWTNGFWTGLLWLAFEFTHDNKYQKLAQQHLVSFKHRLDNEIAIDHHDMGFLYSLSAVASYKITKDNDSKKLALKAAEYLLDNRYQPKGKFIQAWGKKGAHDNYRLIIDALLNIPLIYWAAQETSNQEMHKKALNHFITTLNTIIRDDATTYHTYFFDPKSGKPLYGKTRQGYSDDSCWARGQAWGVYGIALSQKYNQNINLVSNFKALLNVFLNQLPSDDVPYWDLIFQDGSSHSKDSSAASIVVCGILEMLKYFDNDDDKKLYFNIAKKIAKSLIKNYANPEFKLGAPLVLHSVYSYHSKRGNNGIDEGNIWGDYFYFEMLQRLQNHDWHEYW